MKTEDTITFYESVKDDLKFHGISSVRIKIMISLNEGPKKTKELRKLTGIQSSTIIHGINELEKQKLVSRDGDKYYLSETGRIIVLKIVDMVRTLISLKKFQKLWLNHEIEAIPQDLLMKIGDLSNSQLIESEQTDVFKVHETHTQVVLNSKKIRGLSPIFYPNYPEIFKGVIEKDISVELILTEDVLKTTIESLDHGIEDLKKLISTGNLTLWILNKDVKVAFTLTDKFMTMGLFSVDGMYDSTKNLVSDHNDTIAWGNRLFEYYRQKADKLEL